MKTWRSLSSRETMLIGREIAKKILHPEPAKRRQALVIALTGNLGAGKTTFVQGFLQGLGIRKRSPSPTFIIFRRHAIKRRSKNPFRSLYHMDAYRLKDAAALGPLEFKSVLADPTNLILIEWAERIRKALPKDAIRIAFRHGKKENERRIIMSG